MRRGRERYAVRAEPLDRLNFGDILESSTRIAALVETAPEIAATDYNGWADLVGDVFCAYRGQHSPEFTDPDELRASRRLNSEVIQALTSPSGAFAQTRAYTRANNFEAAVATLTAATTLRELLATELAEQADAAQQAEQLEQELAALQDSGDPDAEAAAEATQERLDKLTQTQAHATQAVRDAIAAAADSAAAAAKVAGQLPGVGAGQLQRLSLDEQLAVAEMWVGNPRLEEIVRLAGRLQRDMTRARARRTKVGRETPVEVIHSDDLSALLAHEQMGFAVPALRRDTLQRLGQRQLLTWSFTGEDPASAGPVIVVVDSSGSMAGERIVWAKAVCMAVVAIAHRSRRDVAVIEFSGRGQVTCDLLPHRLPDPKKLAGICARHFGGGTDGIDQALSEAAALTDAADVFTFADVILITDGEASVTDRTHEARRRLTALGVRVQGVTIQSGPSCYTNAVCDTQTEAADMAGPSDATRHIATHLH